MIKEMSRGYGSTPKSVVECLRGRFGAGLCKGRLSFCRGVSVREKLDLFGDSFGDVGDGFTLNSMAVTLVELKLDCYQGMGRLTRFGG